MKELTLFYLEGCPYCVRARQYMQELCQENPSYAGIPITLVEESRQESLAAQHEYFYVPCYYIAGEKIAEGSIDKAGVKAVFEAAL